MFRYFKHRRVLKEEARMLYKAAVRQARLPIFYKELGVPDSFDGRFELLALHCCIIMSRLKREGQTKLSQALFDVFFISMDRSLRELGVGDVGVPKHMKRMMQGFNGRFQHYENAIKSNDLKALSQALIRNVYGTLGAPPTVTVLAPMLHYVKNSCALDVTDAGFATIDINQEMSYG